MKSRSLLTVGLLVLLAKAIGSDGSGEMFYSPPLPYDPAAYEMEPHFRRELRCWTADELKGEISARVAFEKQRREMNTYYYRIGHTLAFPLPLTQRPALDSLPPGLPKRNYPWMIWLTWDLDERWRLFHFAWKRSGDAEAGQLLQRELAALSSWDRFHETMGEPGLMSAYIGSCLSLALADASPWQAGELHFARAAATNLIERDIWPWFEKHWSNAESYTPARMHNIPVIALVRAAQLARVIDHPRAPVLQSKAREVLRAWWRFRLGEELHTEGHSYDGFLMDAVTEWLEGEPDRAALLEEGRRAFRSLADEWIYMTLPGRPDLAAPVGDVEPEMGFWADALERMSRWYGWNDANWLLQHFQVQRMRVPLLVAAVRENLVSKPSSMPRVGAHEHLHAVTMRTGWTGDDLLAVAGLNRNKMSHLHADTGHLTLGWKNRFWVIDPGYQQYRPGEERDYSFGPQAHNVPLINGVHQTRHTGRLLLLETNRPDASHLQLDLTDCYAGLPKKASVKRDIWLRTASPNVVIVRDTFAGCRTNSEISTSWQGGTHLAWAFQNGWARLSDGRNALWMGSSPGAFEAKNLTKHPGSRGPLTLAHAATLPEGNGIQWWIFCCDPDGSWTAPSFEAQGRRMTVQSIKGSEQVWTVE